MGLFSGTEERAINPAQKFIEWKGSTGRFVYYDKLRENPDGSTGAEITLPDTMHIMFITQLSTVAGFSKKDNCGVYANEVKNLSKDPLSVKTRKGEIATGLYSEIKEMAVYFKSGAKFAKSIYCMLLLGKEREPEFVNFKLYGCSIGPWIDFVNNTYGRKTMEDGYSIKMGVKRDAKGEPELQHTGDNTYYIPTFERIDSKQLPQAIIDKGIQAYKELAEYHASKLHNDKERIELGGGDVDLNQTFTDDTYTQEVGGVPDNGMMDATIKLYGQPNPDKRVHPSTPVEDTADDLPF